MANTLGRNLKAGDKLVMANGAVVEVAEPLLFGAMSFTSGSALIVEHHGDKIKTSGYDIDAEATRKQFTVKNGWNIPESQPQG